MVGHHFQALLLDIRFRVHPGFKHCLEHGFRRIAIDDPFVDQADKRSEVLRGQGQLGGFLSLLLEQAEQVAHDPVGHFLGLFAPIRRRFKEVRHGLVGGNHAAVVFREAQLFYVAPLLFVRKLRQLFCHPFDPFVADFHRRQIRLGEIPVILGIFLRAHGEGLALLIVPPPGLLNDAASRFQNGNLPLGLIVNGTGHRFERIHILHLGAHAEFLLSHRAHRNVHVRPQRTLLHLAVGHTDVLQRGFELFQIRGHLLGRTEVRFGHDFQKRHAAAVVVGQGCVLIRLVHQLARVLLHVDFLDADGLYSRASLDFHRAVLADGQIKLGNLIGFGKVGIEVVLPVKLVEPGNGAVGGEPRPNGVLHHAFVEHRQSARHSRADRAAVSVRVAAELGGAGTENLRFGGKLGVNLQPNHHLVFHRFSPPSCGRLV